MSEKRTPINLKEYFSEDSLKGIYLPAPWTVYDLKAELVQNDDDTHIDVFYPNIHPINITINFVD